MNKDLDKKLCDTYPVLFSERHGDMKQTAMCWGFECGDGWYNIIDRLCALIQWEVDERDCPPVTVTQVKEKFGTLRFYYNGGNDAIAAYVEFAEAMSSVTCDVCGCPGELRGHSWLTTRCDEHDDYQ